MRGRVVNFDLSPNLSKILALHLPCNAFLGTRQSTMMDLSNSSDQFKAMVARIPKAKARGVKKVTGARKAKLPNFIAPQLATTTTTVT
jgi:hypothetical protein